ncbi:MAG: hypothetical protein MJ116_05245 [Lachnospiraceae bacterium]|nr:hypothetical protein [Lachnospiraceae bacterium]
MMNKKAMVGVIVAVTIAAGGGAGLTGYVMHHSHQKANSIEKTIKNTVSEQMADKPVADLVTVKINTSRAETENVPAQKNAEKAVAEQEAFAKMEAEKAAVDQQSVITYLAGSPVYPEAMEVGMMAGDCISEIMNLMGGSNIGDEYELTAEQPILYTLEADGSFELVDFYAPLEAGVKYFTKIDVHCAEKNFSADVKLADSLEEWHIAAINGNTATLCSPVIMPGCGAC